MELLSGLLSALRGGSKGRTRVMEERALEVYDIIRSIRDPEKPSTLEDLEVVSESCVTVEGLDEECFLVIIRFTPTVPHCSLATLIGAGPTGGTRTYIENGATKVVEGALHMQGHQEKTSTGSAISMEPIEGLCLRVKLQRCLSFKHKLEIYISEGTHSTEEDINKQINDKERVSAAMENPNLREIVEQCVTEPD